MNKLIKIGVAILFTFFLAACDNFTNSEKTAKNQLAEVLNQEKKDFEKIIEWNQDQEVALAETQSLLQSMIETGDKAKIEDALSVFETRVNDAIKNLDAVDIKSETISQFKVKTKETFILFNDLIAESVKTMANPIKETQLKIQEKTQAAIKAGTELREMQQKIQQKFMQLQEKIDEK